MHFWFALDLSDIDLLNVGLLHQRCTHLDLFVSKTSWRRLQDMSPRRLQDMSSRRLQDMSSRHLQEMSSRRLQDISSRHLQDMSSRRRQNMYSRHLQDFFRVTTFRLPRRFTRCLQDVFKMSWRYLGRRKIVTLKTCWRLLQDVLKTNKCLVGCCPLLIRWTHT